MAFRITAVLGLDGSAFEQGLQRAGASATRFGNSLTRNIGSRLAGIFSIGAIGYGLKRLADYGGKLTDLSARTGVAVESLQRMDRAVKNNGAELETLIAFWDALARARATALANPTGRQAAAFAALGISPNALKTSGVEDLTRQIVLKVQNTGNINNIMGELMAVGGRGVGNLVAAFREGLDQMYNDVHVMTAAQADQLDQLGDAWQNLMLDIMAGMAPLLEQAATFARKSIIGGRSVATAGAVFLQEFFGGKSSFNEAIKSGLDEATSYFQEQVGSWDAEIAAREERIRNRINKPPLEFTPLGGAETVRTGKISPLASDALVQVGNFLGTGRSTLEALANRQVELLARIDTNIKTIANKEQSNPWDNEP